MDEIAYSDLKSLSAPPLSLVARLSHERGSLCWYLRIFCMNSVCARHVMPYIFTRSIDAQEQDR